MKKRIFITATNTDIGKTNTTELLLRELSKRGYKVGIVKPIETGVVDGVYPDGDLLLRLLKECNPQAWSLEVSDVVPIAYELPAAPAVASGFSSVDFSKIQKAIEAQELLCDILLIEGAGGLFVPIEGDYMMLDLIKQTNAFTLLVTHCSLGCINDTLVHKEALSSRNIAHEVVFNCRDEEQDGFNKISLPYFSQKFQDVFTTKDIALLVTKMGF